MSTPLAPVAPKLAKLIPRLATGHDGEVVATVRAMERTLAGAELDFHALAEAVRAGVPRPEPGREPDSWLEVARWCRDEGEFVLSDREFGFLRDMCWRLVCGGEPTGRQAAWLRAIYSTLRARHGDA